VNLSTNIDTAGRRLDDFGDQLQKSALTRAVASDDGDLLSAIDIQRDSIQGCVFLVCGVIAKQAEYVEESVFRRSVKTINLAEIPRADKGYVQ
jgi:hypothetical protein